MPHQVFVRVSEKIVALGSIRAEVEPIEDRHALGEAILHLLATTELIFVVEVRDVDYAV